MAADMLRVLIVSTDTGLAPPLMNGLGDFETVTTDDCRKAACMLRQQPVDVLLVDWSSINQDDLSDFSSVRWASTFSCPMILLTTIMDGEIKGIDYGFDDFVILPCRGVELSSRVQLALRRAPASERQHILRHGKVVMDVTNMRVRCNGSSMQTTKREFAMLLTFLQQPMRVFSRSELIEAAWPAPTVIEERTIDVHIRRLRKKLADHGCRCLIQTRRGHGYSLVEGGDDGASDSGGASAINGAEGLVAPQPRPQDRA